jgi:L-rhamnose 1-dehydrogenase
MAKLLDGKVAAITGGATGIGKAIALEYTKHGAHVAVNYYPDDKSEAQFDALVQEAGTGTTLIGVAGDISKPGTGQELVAKTVEKFGKLDIFVSNAGVCQFADFLRYVTTTDRQKISRF